MTPNRTHKRPDPPEGHLWLDQAATYCGMSKSTFYKWRQNGVGPEGKVIGLRRIAYKISDLDVLIGREPSEPIAA